MVWLEGRFAVEVYHSLPPDLADRHPALVQKRHDRTERSLCSSIAGWPQAPRTGPSQRLEAVRRSDQPVIDELDQMRMPDTGQCRTSIDPRRVLPTGTGGRSSEHDLAARREIEDQPIPGAEKTVDEDLHDGCSAPGLSQDAGPTVDDADRQKSSPAERHRSAISAA